MKDESSGSFTWGYVSLAVFHTLHLWQSPVAALPQPLSILLHHGGPLTKLPFVLAVICLTSSQL